MKQTLKRYPLVVTLARAVTGLQRDVQFQIENARLARRRAAQIDAYMASHPIRKLQIGSGPVKLDGWLNSDLRPRRDEDIFLDARERLPFEDRSIDYIHSEHLVQHLTYLETRRLHEECFRVLKPGGKLRVAAPNLWSFASLCGTGASERHKDHIRWYVDHYIHRNEGADGYAGGFVINNMMKEAEFLYDPETLRLTLENAGFTDIAECAIGESEDENLRGLEAHGQVIGTDAINVFETFIMEASRPRVSS